MIFTTLKSAFEKSPKVERPETITLLSGVGCFVIIANRPWLKSIGEFSICGRSWKFWVKDNLQMAYVDGMEIDDCDDLVLSGCNFLVLPNEKRKLSQKQLDRIWYNDPNPGSVNLPVVLKCGECKDPLYGTVYFLKGDKPEFVIFVERCRCVDKSENDEQTKDKK